MTKKYPFVDYLEKEQKKDLDNLLESEENKKNSLSSCILKDASNLTLSVCELKKQISIINDIDMEEHIANQLIDKIVDNFSIPSIAELYPDFIAYTKLINDVKKIENLSKSNKENPINSFDNSSIIQLYEASSSLLGYLLSQDDLDEKANIILNNINKEYHETNFLSDLHYISKGFDINNKWQTSIVVQYSNKIKGIMLSYLSKETH